jgi:hypothetical protein
MEGTDEAQNISRQAEATCPCADMRPAPDKGEWEAYIVGCWGELAGDDVIDEEGDEEGESRYKSSCRQLNRRAKSCLDDFSSCSDCFANSILSVASHGKAMLI